MSTYPYTTYSDRQLLNYERYHPGTDPITGKVDAPYDATHETKLPPTPGRAHFSVDDPVALKDAERALTERIEELRRDGARADELADAEFGLSLVRQALKNV